ncbi:MAG: putative HD phosphohydrolase [Candidatus Azotimanducaceae bacterium]|jgi:predicted HD phosphohydrolase
MSEQRAQFRRFDECTKEDMDIIGEHMAGFRDELPGRVIAHLELLKGDCGGFNVDRYEHSLQTATRAHRDGRDEEYVVCALLHDIGDTLAPYNHGALAAGILKPFVSDEKNLWMLEHHTSFQGYYFFEFIGADKNAREKHRDHPAYEHTKEFIDKYDMPAFDENYDTMTIEEFEPMVRRVLSKAA